MKTYSSYLVLFILLSFVGTVNSKDAGLFIPNRMVVTAEVQLKEEIYGPLKIIEGEVLETGNDYLLIRGRDGKTETFTLSAESTVFVNGQEGEISALRPVSPGLFFAVRLYFTYSDNLCLVDGWYVGGVVKVNVIDVQKRLMYVQAVENGESYLFLISPNLKEKISRLAPGTACFILIDYEHGIRRIFIDE